MLVNTFPSSRFGTRLVYTDSEHVYRVFGNRSNIAHSHARVCVCVRVQLRCDPSVILIILFFNSPSVCIIIVWWVENIHSITVRRRRQLVTHKNFRWRFSNFDGVSQIIYHAFISHDDDKRYRWNPSEIYTNILDGPCRYWIRFYHRNPFEFKYRIAFHFVYNNYHEDWWLFFGVLFQFLRNST